VEQILAWADTQHAATGQWPAAESGPVTAAPGETWRNVDAALRQAARGLTGRSSLPRLLAKHRGTRNMHALPRLTVDQILAWADAHHAATGRWPDRRSGPVLSTPGETWSGIRSALQGGHRGLPAGLSLTQLLARSGRSNGR
jgi:hypothetical protein